MAISLGTIERDSRLPVLAHGTELDVISPDYFVLTIELLSSLPSDLAKQRLQYVRDFCHLDPNQETFTKSTTEYRGNYESRFEGRFQQAIGQVLGIAFQAQPPAFSLESPTKISQGICVSHGGSCAASGWYL